MARPRFEPQTLTLQVKSLTTLPPLLPYMYDLGLNSCKKGLWENSLIGNLEFYYEHILRLDKNVVILISVLKNCSISAHINTVCELEQKIDNCNSINCYFLYFRHQWVLGSEHLPEQRNLCEHRRLLHVQLQTRLWGENFAKEVRFLQLHSVIKGFYNGLLIFNSWFSAIE